MSKEKKKADPLTDLLLDADELDRTRLANALKDYLGIDTKSGKVIPKPSFEELSTRQKVLAYILGCKVSVLLDKSDTEKVAPKDISPATGIPKGTVYPKLKELKEDRLISQNDSSKYYVASHQILTAIDELEKTGGKDE